MKNLKVEDMHCNMCVKRISNALDLAGIKFSISLSDKIVSVEDSMVDKAIEELDDLGFEAVLIK